MDEEKKEKQSNHNFKMVKIYLLTGIITLLSIPILGIFAFFYTSGSTSNYRLLVTKG